MLSFEPDTRSGFSWTVGGALTVDHPSSLRLLKTQGAAPRDTCSSSPSVFKTCISRRIHDQDALKSRLRKELFAYRLLLILLSSFTYTITVSPARLNTARRVSLDFESLVPCPWIVTLAFVTEGVTLISRGSMSLDSTSVPCSRMSSVRPRQRRQGPKRQRGHQQCALTRVGQGSESWRERAACRQSGRPGRMRAEASRYPAGLYVESPFRQEVNLK